MHFFSLFGPTFNINTTSTNHTSPMTTTPIENTQINSVVEQGSISNMVPPELQSILESIIPGIANIPIANNNTSANNNGQREAVTNPPNNSIIMLYEDISAQQSPGLNLTEIHQVSHLLLNEKEDETEETKTCSICQQNIEWDSIIRRINICNHEYHVNCIDQWLVNHNTCPTCRRILVPSNENSNNDMTEERNVNSSVSSYQVRIPLRNNNN